MEIERKVKEDFEFYCGFLQACRCFPKKEDNCLIEAWIHKLTNEFYPGIGDQHNRNIYLAHLVICLQKTKLEPPFNEYPCDYGLCAATCLFGPMSKEIKEPLWLNSVVTHGGDFNLRSKDGRTYLATRNMPDNTGALGYLAVSLQEGESSWIQRKPTEDLAQGDKASNNQCIVKNLLVKRKNLQDRKKTLDLYDYLLSENQKVLDGRCVDSNEIYMDFQCSYISELKKTNRWDVFENMKPEERRNRRLYNSLRNYLLEKKRKLIEHENYLESIEKSIVSKAELRKLDSEIFKDDREAYANKMWEQAINNGPRKKLLNLLTERYPIVLIKKFLVFLAQDKEKIAVKLQKCHENIVSQLKKELQKENYRGKKKCEDAQYALDEISRILDQFETALDYVKQMEKKRQEVLRGTMKGERDAVYHEIKMALKEAQLDVEAEADGGRILTEAINTVTEQNERYSKINEENIRKIEDSNLLLMKSIKKLGKSICLNERRLKSIMMQSDSRNAYLCNLDSSIA